MADDRGTIFGLPVESFGRNDVEEDALESASPLRQWLSTPPSLGWPLTIVLLIVLAESLFDLVYSYVTGEYGIYLGSSYSYDPFSQNEIPRLWSFIILHTSPILRILAVFGIMRTNTWGINLYLVATVLFLLFCTVPEFELWKFSLHILFFVTLVVLMSGKWELFD